MGELRDYQQWHDAYGDPESGPSWWLHVVQRYLDEAFDRQPGPLRVLSLCSGDGRDVLGVLGRRPDAGRVAATLVELHPAIAEDARRAVARAGLRGVEVRTADAGAPDGYADVVPADVVVLVGIFGNISDVDLQRTVRAAPQLCAPGATLLWSRGRETEDLNDQVRRWFGEAGFTELDYATRDRGSRPALGCLRYDGPPTALQTGSHLFAFVR